MENQLITILRISTPYMGSFVKNKFESEGIECFFTNEGTTIGSKYNPDEILLKVKAGNSEKAIKLLLQLHREQDLYSIKEDRPYTQIKKILLPVKISEDCINLCKFAIAIARKTHAEIKLLYVYEDPTLNESERHTVSWERYIKMELQEAHKKAQLKLVNFSMEIKKAIPKEILNSVNLHYRMLKGIPEHVIVDAAERYKPDVILMGSHGKHDFENEFHGKTIARVIENSSFPVLAVPPKTGFNEKEKINVMYATDFYDADNSSLNKLLGILQAFEKQIYCVHIDLHNESHLREKVDELNKMLQRDYSVHNIECILFESDDVVKGLETFAENNKMNLISFSKIKRSAFYKTFHHHNLKRILASEDIPMLIFPV
ncbi:MAG: universal stress protein [Prolixibacteraceae bacterium]|nr:universal stress protein [Prolixibacteraceae bacterium]